MQLTSKCDFFNKTIKQQNQSVNGYEILRISMSIGAESLTPKAHYSACKGSVNKFKIKFFEHIKDAPVKQCNKIIKLGVQIFFQYSI